MLPITAEMTVAIPFPTSPPRSDVKSGRTQSASLMRCAYGTLAIRFNVPAIATITNGANRHPPKHGSYGGLQAAGDNGHPKHQRQASHLRCGKGGSQVDLCVACGTQITAADETTFRTQQQRRYCQSQHRN